MREIKFRAWDRKLLVMMEVRTWCLFEGTLHCVARNDDGFIESSEDEHGYEIMQFTGLKDKKGVEIYEGDILRLCRDIFKEKGNYIGVIKWDMNGFGFDTFKWIGVHSEDVNKWPLLSQFIIYPYNECYEVIGNIYEHSELLERQTL